MRDTCPPGARTAYNGQRAAFALSGVLIAWSLVANWVIGDTAYVPRNVLIAAGALLIARSAGLERAELGMAHDKIGAGLRWGAGAVVVVAAAIGAGLVLAEVLPAVTSLSADERAQLEGAALVTATLVRVPLGTVLLEEVMFRSVLLAVLLRSAPPAVAVVTSSVVFRLWHIAPTVVGLRANDIVASSPEGLGAILAAVVVTTTAGLAFTWLRRRSGSLLAPMLAHWATNALGLLAAATS